jgi:anaerobic magnesium-protoporphyrin IX monomethyl ester cyclase
MSDILLIQPPIRDFYLTLKRTIPYGLSCIAATLIRDGFHVELFDALAVDKSRILNWPDSMAYLTPYYGCDDKSPFGLFHDYRHYGYSFEYIGKRAKASGAFLVGISSLFTAYSEDALETARIVKKCLPGCKIVLGGHHPTHLPESALACEAVDYVIRGEGEVSICLLARAVQKGLPVDQIPGIGYRKNKTSFILKAPVVMENPDQYPLPAVHLIKDSFYRRKNRGTLVITAARGCPMNCTYCAVNASSVFPYRRRKVEPIIAEIDQAISRNDVGLIDFEDENLSMDKKWFIELLNQIILRFGRLNMELRAMNGLYAPTLDEEIMAAMKEAGFKTLNLSLCTTRTEQLIRFRRPDVRRAFESILSRGEKFGLNAVGYLIAGAPDQQPEDSVNDLLYLAGKRVLVGLSIYYPAPGSPDFEQCRRLNILPGEFELMRSSVIPISHRTKREDAITLLRLARILNFMKLLKDMDKTLPEPEPFDEKSRLPMESRMDLGMRILSWFFHDGKIRGISREGRAYEHLVSLEMTRNFLNGLKEVPFKGSGT